MNLIPIDLVRECSCGQWILAGTVQRGSSADQNTGRALAFALGTGAYFDGCTHVLAGISRSVTCQRRASGRQHRQNGQHRHDTQAFLHSISSIFQPITPTRRAMSKGSRSEKPQKIRSLHDLSCVSSRASACKSVYRRVLEAEVVGAEGGEFTERRPV